VKKIIQKLHVRLVDEHVFIVKSLVVYVNVLYLRVLVLLATLTINDAVLLCF